MTAPAETFWRLNPMFADVPRLPGVDLLTTVYMRGGDNDSRPDHPGLRCLRQTDGPDELYFDKRACRDLAQYLKAQGITSADFDFEPHDAGDRQGFTSQNRETAEWIVAEFKANGVRLEMWGTPLEGDTLEWMAALSGNRLHFPAYPINQDPALWRSIRLGELATVRKRCPGARVTVEVCPHFFGGSYDGKQLPPWREFVGGILWDTFVKFAEDFGDSAAVWASGMKADGSGYDPFDPRVPWLNVFGKGRDSVPGGSSSD